MAVKHEYMRFASGAIMLDVWVNGRFYAIQFEDFVGISEINENVGFATNPDEKFYSEKEYKERLNSILTDGTTGRA
jgi:hypothetical protein